MDARRLHRSCTAALLIGVAGIAAFAWWWTHPPDPVEAVRAHGSPLARVERASAPNLGARYERWLLVDQRGDSANALWRRAPAGAERPWTVVVLGGLRTGDRSVLLIPEEMPVNVLAVDWPWVGERRAEVAKAALRAPAIRRAILRSPGVLALGVEAAARQPEVGAGRLVLVGASLGVPPALASLRLTGAADALVILYGSAGLRPMIEIGLRRILKPGWLATVGAAPLAALCDRLIRPLEPALHAEAAAGMPTLMLGAEEDIYLPPKGVEALRRAIPHATWVKLPGSHLLPHDRGGAARIAAEVARWLDALGAEGGRGGADRPLRPSSAPVQSPRRPETRDVGTTRP